MNQVSMEERRKKKKVVCYVQHKYMQGRAPTSMFASNVNQCYEFAQDPKVKYLPKYLQDQTFIAQLQRGRYSTFTYCWGATLTSHILKKPKQDVHQN